MKITKLDFKPMKATNLVNLKDLKDGKHWKSEKKDGILCIASSEGAWSSLGNPITGISHIWKTLPPGNFFLGELLIEDSYNDYQKRFNLTSGLVRNKQIEMKKQLRLHIFDIFLIETPWISRQMQLKYLLQHSNVQIVEQTPIDTKDIKSLKIPKNSEGFIINEESAFYQEGKRIKEQIKIKQCQTADLEIIGWEPGKGKYKDTIGKLVCMYKGYQVKIGSGLTDNDRVMILANWDSIEGMFAEVKAMKFGETSIRMPIFVRLRLDKNEFSID